MRSQCISRPSDLLLADDRDVVLGLAGDDAGVAAGAGPRSTDSAPLGRVPRSSHPLGRRASSSSPSIPCAMCCAKSGSLFVLRRAWRPAQDAVVGPGPRTSILWWSWVEARAAVRPVLRRLSVTVAGLPQGALLDRAQSRSRRSRASSEPTRAGPCATIAQVISVTQSGWPGPDGPRPAMLTTDRDRQPRLSRNLEPVSSPPAVARAGAIKRGVVPGELGERLGALLEPAVVRVRAVARLLGSGRKTTSSSRHVGGGFDPARELRGRRCFALAGLRGSPNEQRPRSLGTMPSWSERRQNGLEVTPLAYALLNSQ